MEFPALHGNWIDLGIIIIAFLYLFGGWKRGFILGVVDLVGFLLSFFLALRSYSFFGSLLVANFSFPKGIANATGFILGGIIAEMLFSAIIVNIFVRYLYFNILKKQAKEEKKAFISRFDKIFGFIPALGEALVLITFLLTVLVSLPIHGAIKRDVVSSKVGGPLVARAQGIERQINSIFGEAVNETLTFFTINPSPNSSESVKLYFTQSNVKIDEQAEQIMLNLINQERTKSGLRHLSRSFELQALARDYGKDMFARGYFSHNSPEGQSPFDRMGKRQISFNAAGENLALAPNVHLAHQGLMNSEGHRRNILSSEFNKIGIGVIDGGIYGEIFVQEFTD